MSDEHKWLMIDMHTHSEYSKMRKTGEAVKHMSAEDFVKTLYGYGVRIFSITDHNYFSASYYDEIDSYIHAKQLDAKIINGTELDVYVTTEDGQDKFIHICFYFEDSVDRTKLQKAIDSLYPNTLSKPNLNTILIKLSELDCKFIAIPHGDKDKRGLFAKQLIMHLSPDQKADFYKYAMYKIFNAFDIKPGSFGDSENHWALNFYSSSESFGKIVDGKTDEEIGTIINNLVNKLKDNSVPLSAEEEKIMEHIKKYSSYFAYFSFSDWHNENDYCPVINNFIFGSLQYAFSAFELATLDPSSRIQQAKEKEIVIQDTIIKRVSFDVNGKRKNVDFSPGLNAIVGKRGSGKSLLVSVIDVLANGITKESQISKYSNFRITNISGLNRKNIPIYQGRLNSVVFLGQDDIKNIIEHPEKANETIAKKFPSIQSIEQNGFLEIFELCNQVIPLNKNYKSLTAEISSLKSGKNYSFSKTTLVDYTSLLSEFNLIQGSLGKIKGKLSGLGFNINDLSLVEEAVDLVKERYLKKVSLLNSLLQKHNSNIESANSRMSSNELTIKSNRLSIKNAIQIVKSNFSILLAKKKLFYLLNNFRVVNPPAEIVKEGKYLFVTFYDIKDDIKDLVQQKVLGAITRSGDELDSINQYVNGSEIKKLKSGYKSLMNLLILRTQLKQLMT